jgi:hypothetical protein
LPSLHIPHNQREERTKRDKYKIRRENEPGDFAVLFAIGFIHIPSLSVRVVWSAHLQQKNQRTEQEIKTNESKTRTKRRNLEEPNPVLLVPEFMQSISEEPNQTRQEKDKPGRGGDVDHNIQIIIDHPP